MEEYTMFDMSNLKRLEKLKEHAPEAVKAFWAFDKAAFEAGEVSVQTKQLIAVAVALTTSLLHRGPHQSGSRCRRNRQATHRDRDGGNGHACWCGNHPRDALDDGLTFQSIRIPARQTLSRATMTCSILDFFRSRPRHHAMSACFIVGACPTYAGMAVVHICTSKGDLIRVPCDSPWSD
jgi:hypothetical protein